MAAGALVQSSRRLGRRATRSLAPLVVVAAGAVCVAPVVVDHPDLLRLLFAGTIALALLTLCFTRPAVGVVTTIGFLMVLALVRRLLIADAGWSGADPLLLVGPAIATILLVKLLVIDRRPLAPDGISLLVTVMLVLTFLQVGNPGGGGIAAGLGGLLFIAVPLFWFYIGRELASDALAGHALWLLVLGAAAIGMYGLLQTEAGFPSWDREWLLISGWDSLNVGETVRGFGTFASSAEYAFTLGAALAVACSLILLGRTTVVLALPILAVALFLASARGPLIMAVGAVVVLLGLRSGSPRRALAVALASLVVGGGALVALGPGLSGAGGGNDLVAHQLEGVSDPLNPENSTLLLHLELVVDGVARGVAHPLGSGTGATNNASSKLGGGNAVSQGSEVDISNAFISLGLLGGFAYIALLVLTLRRAAQGWFAGHKLMLPVLAVLVVTLGQWLIGGHYALAPLTWLLIGYVAATVPRRPARADV